MGHEMPQQTPRGCVLVRGAGYHGKEVRIRLSQKGSGALLRPLRDLWKIALHQKAILTAIVTAANLGCKYNNYLKTMYVTWVLRNSHIAYSLQGRIQQRSGERLGRLEVSRQGWKPSWRSGHHRQRWELFGLILKSATYLSFKGSVRQTLSIPNI